MRIGNWEFVSIVIAVLGILVSVVIPLLQRDLKKLEVNVVSATSLIDLNDAIKDKVQVLYEDKPVTNLSVINVRIRNSGNQPILPSDYVQPLTLVFPTGTVIAEAIVTESKPLNIGMTIQVEENKVSLSKALLNQEDETTVSIFTINSTYDLKSIPFTMNGRLVGVKQIELNMAATQQSDPISISLSVIILIGTVVSILGIYVGVRISRSRQAHPK